MARRERIAYKWKHSRKGMSGKGDSKETSDRFRLNEHKNQGLNNKVV